MRCLTNESRKKKRELMFSCFLELRYTKYGFFSLENPAVRS